MIELVHVGSDVICSYHLCNSDQLVVIVSTFEEGLFCEKHTGEHAAS